MWFCVLQQWWRLTFGYRYYSCHWFAASCRKLMQVRTACFLMLFTFRFLNEIVTNASVGKSVKLTFLKKKKGLPNISGEWGDTTFVLGKFFLETLKPRPQKEQQRERELSFAQLNLAQKVQRSRLQAWEGFRIVGLSTQLRSVCKICRKLWSVPEEGVCAFLFNGCRLSYRLPACIWNDRKWKYLTASLLS